MIKESLRKEPLISICILNYNWKNRLQKVIPSILSQKYSNSEILLLDNWSTDNSLDYISQFNEIKIIRSSTNLWTSWWRNKLSNYAKWDYLLFIDNDIELTSKYFVADMINMYIALKKVNIWVIVPIVKTIDEEIYCEAWLYYNKIVRENFKDIYRKWYIKKPGFAAGVFFIEKKIFINLWRFDEKYPYNMDDNDFSMRLYTRWYSIYVNTNQYVIHHWIETRTTPKLIWRRHQYYFCGLMRALLKNYRVKNLLIWCPIILGQSCIKACKLSIIYKSILPLKWFFISVKTFFIDLKDTLRKRSYIQSTREEEEDIFLKIE